MSEAVPEVTPETKKLLIGAMRDRLLHLRELAGEGKLPDLRKWEIKGAFVKLKEVGGPVKIGSSWQEFNGLVEISQLPQSEAQIAKYQSLKAGLSANLVLNTAVAAIEKGKAFFDEGKDILGSHEYYYAMCQLDMFVQTHQPKSGLAIEEFKISKDGVEHLVTKGLIQEMYATTCKPFAQAALDVAIQYNGFTEKGLDGFTGFFAKGGLTVKDLDLKKVLPRTVQSWMNNPRPSVGPTNLTNILG